MADEIAIKRIYELATLTESTSGYFIALDKNGNIDAVKLDLNTFISALNHNDFGGKQGGITNEYYHLSADELVNSQLWQVITGGINRATGNVGIGVATPLEALDIDGSILALGNYYSNSATASIHGYLHMVGIKARWFTYANDDAESGSNAGSNYSISRYNDAGGFLGVTLSIRRDTGYIALGNIIPNEQLHVLGNIKATGNLIGNATQVVALEKDSVATAASGDTLNFTANTDYKITASAATSFSLTGLTKTDQALALYFTQDPATARTLTITYSGKTFGGSGCLSGSGTDTITVDVSSTLSAKTKVVFHSEDATNIWVSVDTY